MQSYCSFSRNGNNMFKKTGNKTGTAVRGRDIWALKKVQENKLEVE